MKKHFISAQQLLVDSYLLAEKVLNNGFKPTYIVGVWRGGAPIGIAIQEYFDYKGVNTDHICIRTSAYSDINKAHKQVSVDGLHYLIERIKSDDSILIVDDVFDTGKSVAALLLEMKTQAKGRMPNDIRLAVPWFKPRNNTTDITPHYYLHESNDWLVFPHEVKGLSHDEIVMHKTDLANVLGLFE